MIKAGRDHEHFASLDGPDCDPPPPTNTPQPTPTDTPQPGPTDTPVPTSADTPEPTPTLEPDTPDSDVQGEVVGPTPASEVLGLPATGTGGPAAGSSIVLYLALASLGAGLTLLGYWRHRLQISRQVRRG